MRLFYLASALAALTACGGGSDNLEPTGPGSIDVTTTTTGANKDADGYGIMVDGAARGNVGANATQHLDPLDPGDHDVSLSGVADNCSVTLPERTVVVRPGETTVVQFQVLCQDLGGGGDGGGGGGLDVTTLTTGSALDPDGYILGIDGKDRLRIGVNASAAFSSLLPGNHTVVLRDIAASCRLNGQSPRSVTVGREGTTAATLTVTCSG